MEELYLRKTISMTFPRNYHILKSGKHPEYLYKMRVMTSCLYADRRDPVELEKCKV